MSEKRAAIYTRVSTDRQEADGASLDTQLADGRERAIALGYEAVEHFTDTHTGTQYRERPGLTKLREQVRSGVLDVVIAWDTSRVSRNMAHFYIIYQEFQDHGVRLEFVTQDFEDTATGRFILSAYNFADEVENEKRSEKASRGRRNRAESGKYLPGAKAPYGFKLSKDRTKLEINDEEAAIVRRIFRDYVDGGSLRGIAISLRKDGILTPTGKTVWYPSTLKFILENEAYIGRVISHGDIVLEDVAPPIVDESSFAIAGRRLKINKQRSKRNGKYPDDVAILRAGIAVCGLCETSMHVIKVVGDNSAYVYSCRTADRSAACTRHSMRTHLLDTQVWEGFCRRLTDDDLFSEGAEGLLPDDPGPELAGIERTLASIERQHSNIARRIALTDDDDSAAVLMGQLDSLSKRRRGIEVERDEIAGQKERWAQSRRLLDDLEHWRRATAETLDVMDAGERRNLLDMFGVTVRLWPSDHHPRWVATSEIIPAIVFDISESPEHNQALRLVWTQEAA